MESPTFSASGSKSASDASKGCIKDLIGATTTSNFWASLNLLSGCTRRLITPSLLPTMSEVGAIFSCGKVSHAGNCATAKSLFHSFKACSKSSASRAFAVTANKTPSELFAM